MKQLISTSFAICYDVRGQVAVYSCLMRDWIHLHGIKGYSHDAKIAHDHRLGHFGDYRGIPRILIVNRTAFQSKTTFLKLQWQGIDIFEQLKLARINHEIHTAGIRDAVEAGNLRN